MKDFMSFFSQNKGFIVIVVGIVCILIGRIWSNNLNWGEITEPHLILKKNKIYKVINVYGTKMWTEDWIVGSIICLKSYHRRFFVSYTKEIYVSGDRIRFTDDGPVIGLYYQVTFSKITNGPIVMKPVQKPPNI